MLEGLKHYTNNLTAIVTVSDYGEGMSNSRKELEILPLEDIKDSIISLASNQNQVGQLFNYEFKKGKLDGLKFSDIYFSAMQEINENFEDSIIKSNQVINMIGKVVPVTLDEMKIVAELENGYIVEEKSRIPEVVSEKITKINRIYLNPSNCRPAPGVIETIKNADCIIIGPGSLYTNVIPNLLVNGVAKAIKESAAIKVYISNIMTEPGQTDDYSVADHLKAIIEHCGEGIVDYCIYDTGEVVPEFIKRYNVEGQDLVDQDIEKVRGIKFLQRNLSSVTNEHIRHDPNSIAQAIIELVCDDLKYQDKQNDPQYLMLNNKLKQEKRINKIKKEMAKKEKRKKKGKEPKAPKGKSKFSNKYSERIASIRQADEMAKIKTQKQQSKKKKEKPKTTAEIIEELEKQTHSNIEKPKAKKKTSSKSKKNEQEPEKVTKPKSARGLKRNTQNNNKE